VDGHVVNDVAGLVVPDVADEVGDVLHLLLAEGVVSVIHLPIISIIFLMRSLAVVNYLGSHAKFEEPRSPHS